VRRDTAIHGLFGPVVPRIQLTGVAVPHAARPDLPTASLPLAPLLSMRCYIRCLVVLDAAVAALATLVGMRLRLQTLDGDLTYLLLAVLFPCAWVFFLMSCGCYQHRSLVVGSEEYRRVTTAGTWLLAGVAITSYLTHADLSRAVIAITTPLVILLTLGARLGARKAVHRRLLRGRTLYRVVVAGSRQEVRDLVRHIRRARHAGYDVVGACAPGKRPIPLAEGGLPVLGPVGDVAEAARRVGADTIAVAGTSMLPNGALRRLSWQLEGTGTHLVVAPTITDLAGPRILNRPVDGLPLLHVQEPEFSGGRRVVKEVADRVAAVLLLLLLMPVLLGTAVAVLVTDPGPVFFRQERVGQHGRRFVLWKFRTMREGAEREHAELVHLNEHDGPLFKIRKDPRITPIGRWLRRYSLDELPQLWNVATGSMSLVGPRPPLPAEAATFPDDVRRRMLVKPGITGLWQVSGRSDLSWEEAVRLDLHYVENWSVAMDLVLLCRTLRIVLKGRGAY
jgi:exopolysaccharide biosynthesis polyprenyl glycosylphosphotransferase